MRINEDTAILAGDLVLVPYESSHVPKYHEWMQDEELQQLTASEPLTLEQEYEMQQNWRRDADKLTFIVCHLQALPSAETRDRPVTEWSPPATMIGDINLFLSRADEDEEGEDVRPAPLVGEIELMIAEPGARGRGYGARALAAMVRYVLEHVDGIVAEFEGAGGARGNAGLGWLRVKIHKDNWRSIRLFEAAGFRKVREEPNYFEELELRLGLAEARARQAGGDGAAGGEPRSGERDHRYVTYANA